jgi:hypothetical protein
MCKNGCIAGSMLEGEAKDFERAMECVMEIPFIASV